MKVWANHSHPRGSILHPFKISQVPYDAKHKLFAGFVSSGVIPVYIPHAAIGVAYFPSKILATRSFEMGMRPRIIVGVHQAIDLAIM